MYMQTFYLEEALIYLKKGEIIKTINQPFFYFILLENKIIVMNENSRSQLSIDDFNHLYSHEKFTLHLSEKETEISLEKDQEYYSWKQ